MLCRVACSPQDLAAASNSVYTKNTKVHEEHEEAKLIASFVSFVFFVFFVVQSLLVLEAEDRDQFLPAKLLRSLEASEWPAPRRTKRRFSQRFAICAASSSSTASADNGRCAASNARNCAGARCGSIARIRATTPLTCALASELPEP